jgi:hypothetical protein
MPSPGSWYELMPARNLKPGEIRPMDIFRKKLLLFCNAQGRGGVDEKEFIRVINRMAGEVLPACGIPDMQRRPLTRTSSKADGKPVGHQPHSVLPGEPTARGRKASQGNGNYIPSAAEPPQSYGWPCLCHFVVPVPRSGTCLPTRYIHP